MAWPTPTGRERAIEALIDREPHGDFYRAARVVVRCSTIYIVYIVVVVVCFFFAFCGVLPRLYKQFIFFHFSLTLFYFHLIHYSLHIYMFVLHFLISLYFN
jgi:hypothetical protein